ncbi:MAG: AMP-binding protein [Bacillota bacterium]|nr:AMP-binding protein [Bacillota bacterium]
MALIDRFCRTDFSSYEDFYKNFKLKIPENFNFAFDVVDELAALRPDKQALLWCNDHGEERRFTFSDLKRLSGKTANYLRRLGISRGDRVMLILKRRYEYWYTALALHKLGAVLIPATHQLTVKDIKYRVKAADVKMILCVNEDLICSSVLEARGECGDILKITATIGERDGFFNFTDGVNSSAEEFMRPEGYDAAKPQDAMLMYFTSGTTGMPKMVVHDFNYPLAHILTAKFWQDLRETDLHLTVADTGWAKCSWGKIYGQWICEACIFVYDYGSRFQPVDLLHMIAKYKITTFCAPPTIFRFFIKEDLSGFDLSSLRASYIAGEPLNAEVYNKWYKATGLKMREGFGQSESAVLVATFPWIEPKPGSTGLPCPHFKTCLLDSEGRICEAGEEGEICVDMREGHPVGLVKEYFGDPAKTADTMHDGWYHTGDLAWTDEDGYFWFIGRNDDVIKSSGYRIGPFEIESALIEHPAVLETAITAVPDPVRGQIVKATIVLAKGYKASEALKKELQEHVKKTTAPYKYPRIIDFVDELPKTISGKIKRVEIRQKDDVK